MSNNSFKGEKPAAMVEFLSLFNDVNKLPASFYSVNGELLLSIQYLIKDCWSTCFDSSNDSLKFAVSTDGWDLLLKMSDGRLEVFQDEAGDIDGLGVTIFDLLNAKVEKF